MWQENSARRLTIAGDILAKIVQADRCQIGTGFIGTPIICDALTRSGHSDLAFKMLLKQNNPSWLYPITMGATTTWERWDSMLPSGKINPGEMTSFNHYAFGAVADWMHRCIGGLSSAVPGWREVLVKPVLGGNITHAFTSHESMFGKISVRWKLDGSKFDLEVIVPANVTATVELPDGVIDRVGSGTHLFTAIVE
jgi:alpha-L-rhamnosidase